MRFRSIIAGFLCAVIATGFIATQSVAQTSTTGAIIGTVTDKNGAVLSGAEVEITNAATNQSQKQATNQDGQYNFPAVLPGSYTITVTKQGFRKANVSTFQVEVTKSYPLNFSLEVGEVQQTVEVTATATAEL